MLRGAALLLLQLQAWLSMHLSDCALAGNLLVGEIYYKPFSNQCVLLQPQHGTAKSS